jgi:hypothetical protein
MHTESEFINNEYIAAQKRGSAVHADAPEQFANCGVRPLRGAYFSLPPPDSARSTLIRILNSRGDTSLSPSIENAPEVDNHVIQNEPVLSFLRPHYSQFSSCPSYANQNAFGSNHDAGQFEAAGERSSSQGSSEGLKVGVGIRSGGNYAASGADADSGAGR